MQKAERYQYRGALALVALHERYLREFLDTWRVFKNSGTALPETPDPDYASADSLLRHVLGCARSYMVWMCEKLRLPDPGMEPAPEEAVIEVASADYVEHVLDRWRMRLAEVPEEAFFDQTYLSRWNVEYCIDAMLEHAVMHPVRHTLQLRELMDTKDPVPIIIGLERAALDRWGRGDPSGFLEISAPDVVYFDPFLERRLDGLESLTHYYDSMRGRVRVDHYELLHPQVQLCGDIAVLTFNFVSYSGKEGTHWNCTEVYRRLDTGWKIIQTHWSITRPAR